MFCSPVLSITTYDLEGQMETTRKMSSPGGCLTLSTVHIIENINFIQTLFLFHSRIGDLIFKFADWSKIFARHRELRFLAIILKDEKMTNNF